MFCYINANIIRSEEASLGVRDLSILRGYGIFEYFRIQDHVPLFLQDHLERFFTAAENVFEKVPVTQKDLVARIRELTRLNRMANAGIRIILTGGYSGDGYSPGEPNLIILQEELQLPPSIMYQGGVKLLTHAHFREMPEVKTIGYMKGIWLKPLIKEKNAFDVVYYYENRILELTRSNFFIVNEEGTLVTPGRDILQGITRKKVLEILKSTTSFKYEVRDIPLEEVYSAKEAFLTGTTKKILPVVQLDEHTLGEGVPGPITKKMIMEFDKLATQYIDNQRAGI